MAGDYHFENEESLGLHRSKLIRLSPDVCHSADHAYLQKYRDEYGRATEERRNFAALFAAAKAVLTDADPLFITGEGAKCRIGDEFLNALRAAVEALEGRR